MADGRYLYLRKVVNKSGYILQFPYIPDLATLKQLGEVDPYSIHDTAQFPIGTTAVRGRDTFIYCYNGAGALSAAQPIQGPARAHAEQDDDIVVGAIAAIGAYDVEVTSTANLAAAPLTTANSLAGGYFVVNDEAGEGQYFQIKANDAFSGTASTTISLYDPLTVALSVASQVGLLLPPWYKTIAAAAPLSAAFMGVPARAVTASYYFWSKIKGIAAVNAKVAIAVGQLVGVGVTASQVDLLAHDGTTGLSAASHPIGMAVTPGVADGEKFLVDLF